ncbi:MAG: hypothetical protein WED34_14855 [Planctomycetales bacterium]
MKHVTEDLAVRLETTSGLAREDLLYGGLLAGLAVSFVLLVTMLTTSWGDRRIAPKAFALSLLVHLSCLAGLVLLLNLLRFVDVAEVLQASERQTRILQAVPDADPQGAAGPSGRPAWERLLAPESLPVDRQHRLPLEIASAARPDRNPVPVEDAVASVADPTQVPESAPPAPAPAAGGDAPRLAANAPQPPAPEETAPEARPEVAAPRGTVRQSVTAAGVADRTPAQPQPRRGDPAELAAASPQVSRSPGSALPTDLISPAAPRPAEAGDAGAVRGGLAGPAPAPIPLAAESSEATESTPGSPQAAPAAGLATGAQPQRTGTFRTTAGAPAPRVERTVPSAASETGSLAATAAASGAGASSLNVNVRPAPSVQVPAARSGLQAREAGVPSHLGLRKLSQTPEIALERGASRATLQAVEQSLVWLAKHQEADGRWDADRFGSGQVEFDEQGNNRYFAGREADAGTTGLALLTFLAHGHNHDDGTYARTVERGLTWLVAQQGSDGYLGGKATRHARMYCHGIATYALAEAYGMQHDKTFDTRLRRPLERAVAYTLDQQNSQDGGWRYEKTQVSDMSMFGWQLMALKSAYEALGVPIPAEPRAKMIRFLVDRSLGPNKGLAGYGGNNDATRPTPSMTAEALFCKQMLGISRTNPQCFEALEYLSARPPRRADWNLYYWYYATLAMRSHGGEHWRSWNESLRDVLVAEQRTAGDDAGSWDPIGPWGPYGGRVYTTCLASLCLQVYWRYPSIAPREAPFEPR